MTPFARAVLPVIRIASGQRREPGGRELPALDVGAASYRLICRLFDLADRLRLPERRLEVEALRTRQCLEPNP